MDTPQLQSHIKELQSHVSSYSKKKRGGIIIPFSFQEAFSSKKTYIVIPIAVLVLLIVIRPGFLYHEKQDKKGNVSKSLSFQKILVAWMILSFLIIIGLFGYNYTKKE